MRDPDGSLDFRKQEVLRHVAPCANSLNFLRESVASELASSGAMVPFEFVDEHTLRSPRYPFVAYPFEWCDAQLHRAAQHTLLVAKEALAANYELKDASAWNVIFDGTEPLFCDHLSFESLSSKQWWALGQFARHFIFPLAIARHRGLKVHELFTVYRDGVPIDRAKSFLGLKRLIDRSMPLYLGSGRDFDLPALQERPPSGKTYHGAILQLCEWILDGSRSGSASNWSGYASDRDHYTEKERRLKRDWVHEWLSRTQPDWVLDLGCNTGEFSEIAANAGSRVIAADLDHDCIQILFQRSRDSHRIYPIVVNVADMVGGKGFAGVEFPSFFDRIDDRIDLTMTLALIHHLTISEGIDIAEVARLAKRITKGYLIVEFIANTDPMAELLARQRNRNIDCLTIENQIGAFSKYFDVLDKRLLPSSGRCLGLLKLK